MGEIRLICPDCATVYQVPEAAIPVGGRDVECSECGLSWRAINPALVEPEPEPAPAPPAPVAEPEVTVPTATEPDLAPETTEAPPVAPPSKHAPLEQRLSPNVLNILREAVETERRARHDADKGSSNAVPDIEWPATTITDDDAVMAPLAPKALPPKAPEPTPAPAIIDDAPAAPVVMRPSSAAPATAAPITAKSAPARGNSGYLIGMGVSAMLAAALVTAYVMAPRMADAGDLGAALMDLRHQIDGARIWLDGLIR